MLLIRRNSFCHTLTNSHILLSILILSLRIVNVESVLLLLTNQNTPNQGVYRLSLSSVEEFHSPRSSSLLSSHCGFVAWMLNHWAIKSVLQGMYLQSSLNLISHWSSSIIHHTRFPGILIYKIRSCNGTRLIEDRKVWMVNNCIIIKKDIMSGIKTDNSGLW